MPLPSKHVRGPGQTEPNLDWLAHPESGFRSVATASPLISHCHRVRTTYQAWGSMGSRAVELLAKRAELPSPCMSSSGHRSRSASPSPDSASRAMPATNRRRAALPPPQQDLPRIPGRSRRRRCPVPRQHPRARPGRAQRHRPHRRPRRLAPSRRPHRRRRPRPRSLRFHRCRLLRPRRQPRRRPSRRSRRSRPRSRRSRTGFRDG